MKPMYYIGLDVHKRKISYCVKDSGGQVYAEGSIPARRFDLDRWMKTLPQPWRATLAVARKLVAYLMAVDRGQRNFLVIENEARTAA